MENRFEKLTLFFERIKTISFWQRLFSWKTLRELSYEAYEEFKSLLGSVDRISRDLDQSSNTISILKNDIEHLKENNLKLENDSKHLEGDLEIGKLKISDLTVSIASKDETIRQSAKKIIDQDKEIILFKEKTNQTIQDISDLKKENTIFKQTENDRKTKYEKDVSALNLIREQIQGDRKREIEELQKDEIDKLKSLKETWAKHQDKVKETIKMICQKHTIEYVEKVPFKGSPDNTIKICDEFVVFDAKSPATDDLQNFPTYIRTQTEAVKKYIKEENVRKDIFLVIPSNTVDTTIKQFSYNMADYNVYIVTLDVLEPLILTLKKIEDYEFVDQLTPEERENICRLIGKFAHMTKRRIQIDHFFAWEFLDILTKCKVDLPREILEKVIEFEKSEKLNPPQERRSKQILTQDLQSDSEKIQREAEAKAIIFPPSLQKNLNSLPLYEGEDTSEKI
ncbi:MAG: hypothetical protein WC879_12110 [Melioribacteraceae bacterium]